MTDERFQIHILDNNGNDVDADDTLFTGEQLDRELAEWNAAEYRINGVDAFAVDMADGSRGFIRIVGVAA